MVPVRVKPAPKIVIEDLEAARPSLSCIIDDTGESLNKSPSGSLQPTLFRSDFDLVLLAYRTEYEHIGTFIADCSNARKDAF